ncbi:hypothetical protein FOZ63_033527 [Perkinsus olseni]|uniref:Uncharacterized protein n=2 Tax=Perkinsus olseni TaxID=32597 RepID=A0A7J6SLE8_PEROL|nr:hypothetical protein FOZ63_033527 [Perkinsus olseni]
MVIDVGKELLKDANVRVKAERNGWQIVIDKNNTENLQVAFAGVLITAVAANWNERVKSYIPRRFGRQRTIRAMNRELQVELSSPRAAGVALGRGIADKCAIASGFLHMMSIDIDVK